MKRQWFRLVPSFVLAGTLVLTAGASTERARARPGAAASSQTSSACGLTLQSGGNNGSYSFGPSAGITQPVNVVGNVAACSLNFQQNNETAVDLRVVQWDPLALAPDPTTTALRSQEFGPSEMAYNHLRADFNPPIVVRSAEHVADPPRGVIAVDCSLPAWALETVFYDTNGAPGTPMALQTPNVGPRTPLPGNHPVLSHTICGGDDAVQRLVVGQCVMTTNVLNDTSTYELVQRFRVPVQMTLHWVEFAFATAQYPYPGYDLGAIAIFDAQGASSPPTTLPTSLVQANFSPFSVTGNTWSTHYDFDHEITLEADHDYWLLVRVTHEFFIYSRRLTGQESGDFTSRIGPYLSRTTPTGAWSPISGEALSFRLIGEAPGVIGVSPPARLPSGLRLRATPNPSPGATLVTWSGARGAIRFDVLDARGRRVGGGDGPSGEEGRWLWSGVRGDGRALPAGVYFVRARDGAGRMAIDRVVRVR